MAEQHEPPRVITERELREGEVQMTKSPPVGTGFIGFVPDLPEGYTPLTSPLGETTPAGLPAPANNGGAPDDE
jgi:hypothetical protein